MIDLRPAAERVIRVLDALRDGDLDARTPCTDTSVGDLVDHIGSLAAAFAGAARKDDSSPGAGGAPPEPDAANLGPDWRARIVTSLRDLATAWTDPEAWQGMTRAGGIDLPGEVAGLVALDELVVHGWDVAVATGQSYDVPDEEAEAALSFVASFDAPRDGRLFGPAVPVADDAPPLERLLGLTGRDPRWH